MSGINVQALASRLKDFQEEEKQSEASRHIWKPKEGIQTVRIVPYKFNPENPFIELKFYYKLAGKNYLAPSHFGKPDPILEFVNTLRSSGIEAQRKLAKKLEAKPRTYAPILVRGEEEMGVRFWGFGVTVFKQLLKLITNPKWGDITSLTEGNDIEVEFVKESKKKGPDGKSFPETTITPDPRKTPVVDPSQPELIQKVKNQVDILTCWTLPEYDELKEAMDKFLNPEKASESSDDEVGDEIDETASSPEPAETAAVVTAPAAPKTAPKAEAKPQAAATNAELEQTFDEFFNS